MKKILFTMLMSSGLLNLQAQCTVDPNSSTGLSPDVETNLPVAVAGQAYSTVLQFKVPKDTATEVGRLPIVHIKIDSIGGIPEHFSYETNPSSSVFSGGSRGCILVTGNPTLDQIATSPNADGIYPITVYYTARVTFLFSNIDRSGSYEGYQIEVALTNDVKDRQIKPFSISQIGPNPTHNSTDFVINATSAGAIDFTLYNIDGRPVLQRQVDVRQGENGLHIDVSTLKAGMYMYSFRRGATQVTQRMIVE